MARSIIVIGLGYGDEGKGSLVEFLVHRINARLVVRFNGGSQAAHNVVTVDGRHHTFSQFGSGMFVPGVKTILTGDVRVDPLALLVEGSYLADLGITDASSRLYVDSNANIITPYHVALNRLRELSRGSSPHGSCGKGIGETARDYFWHPDETIDAGDLKSPSIFLEKAERARLRALEEEKNLDLPDNGTVHKNRWVLRCRPSHWQQEYAQVVGGINIVSRDQTASMLRQEDSVFEGAQGVLLDEDYGFHPYTTWSKTTACYARTLLDYAGVPYETIGVTRSYATRHGPGPFVTETAELSELPELHNTSGRWQGAWRTGLLDLPALKYALKADGRVDRLAVTHCDYLNKYGTVFRKAWPICIEYRSDALSEEPRTLEEQGQITQELFRLAEAKAYSLEHIPRNQVCEFISSQIGLPIAVRSFGPALTDKESNHHVSTSS